MPSIELISLFTAAERYALDDDELARLRKELWPLGQPSYADPMVYLFDSRLIRRKLTEYRKERNGGRLVRLDPNATIIEPKHRKRKDLAPEVVSGRHDDHLRRYTQPKTAQPWGEGEV